MARSFDQPRPRPALQQPNAPQAFSNVPPQLRQQAEAAAQSQKGQLANEMYDQRGRLNVRRLFVVRGEELKTQFSSADQQKRLEQQTNGLIQGMEGNTLLQEHVNALKGILKLATPRDAKPFDVMSLSIAINRELDTIESDLKTGIFASPQALIAEQAYLTDILEQLGIDRSVLKKFIDPFPKTEKQKELDKEGMRLARVLTILGAGAMVIITGLLATMSNQNYNATLAWLIPTVLAAMGKDKLFGNRVDAVIQELAFMKESSPFVSYASKFPLRLEKPASSLLEHKSEARKQIAVLQEKEKKSNETETTWKERKDRSREELKRILNPSRGAAAPAGAPAAGGLPLEDAMLQDEQGFLNFALPLINNSFSKESQEVVLRYLREGKAPQIR